MSLRERHAGTGLQILLECDSPFFVGELDDDVNLPRPATRRVRAAPGVMRGKARGEMRSQSCVVTAWISSASDDVDEALRSGHAIRDSNWAAVGRSKNPTSCRGWLSGMTTKVAAGSLVGEGWPANRSSD